MSSINLLTALNEFWRVDNKHGLYPQRNAFDVKIKYSGVIYFLVTLLGLALAIILTVGVII